MKRVLLLLGLLPSLAAAGNNVTYRYTVPVILVRDTCDTPTKPVGKSVYAITCASDVFLLKKTAKSGDTTETTWERRPMRDLFLFTDGKLHTFSVIQQPGVR